MSAFTGRAIGLELRDPVADGRRGGASRAVALILVGAVGDRGDRRIRCGMRGGCRSRAPGCSGCAAIGSRSVAEFAAIALVQIALSRLGADRLSAAGGRACSSGLHFVGLWWAGGGERYLRLAGGDDGRWTPPRCCSRPAARAMQADRPDWARRRRWLVRGHGNADDERSAAPRRQHRPCRDRAERARDRAIPIRCARR